MNRKDFLTQLSVLSGIAFLDPATDFFNDESTFASRLRPVGRALEMEGYYVWCNSPIQSDDGSFHVFFSRWIDSKGMGGWINGSEICRAVSTHAEGPFE